MAQEELQHLSAAEMRLSQALARPKFIAIGCVATLTALGWLSLAVMASGNVLAPQSWLLLCEPGAASGVAALPLILAMWAAMVLAMMLPTAAPMILTYAEIADTATGKGQPVVSPIVLTMGYVAVWLGFAFVVAGFQWLLARAGLLQGGVAPIAGGLTVLAAGLYQFTPLKESCLRQCQRPFPFFFLNWTEQRSGVFRLGLRQGLSCLGCCWAMMLMMFATGAMNVVWMAVLGVLMTIEKLSSTPRFSHAVGCALILSGSAMVVSALL